MRPYGYELDRVTIRTTEADALRGAAERLIAGDSLRAVTADLNDAGHRTSGGNTWKPNVLRRTLLSPRLVGRDQGGEKADWPPILTAKVAKDLHRVLSAPERKNGQTMSTRTYLLTGGVLVCGLCDTQLVARPDNYGKRGYVCASGEPHHGCGKIRINAELIEADVAERVLARLMRVGSRDAVDARLKHVVDAGERADRDIEVAELRMKQLGEDFAEGKIDAPVMHAGNAALRKKIRDLQATKRIGRQAAQIDPSSAQNLAVWWGKASLDQQRALIQVLASKVEVFPAQVRGSRTYDPSRVRITWAK